jgi:hypothetical protein
VPVSAEDRDRVGDCRAVVVENEHLRLTVLPELGAKIYDIVHKGSGNSVLWHNPRIRPRKVPFGSRFDDVYSGGWDEIFPSDAESVVGIERFPEMGETWPLEWDYDMAQGRDSVALTTEVMTPISPVKFRRRLTLKGGESRFVCDYEIRNLSHNEIKFLWKVHAAFPVDDKCSIEIPATQGIVDAKYCGNFSTSPYAWPVALTNDGRQVDVSRADPSRNDCTCHFVTGLSEGVVGFVDASNGLRSIFHFDRKVLDNVWLFLAYGGWRGHYTAIIEPSTSYPGDLAAAIKEGHVSTLPGKGVLTTSVEFGVEKIGEQKGGKKG